MKVKFVPQNVEFEIKPNESVMHVAQDHGIYIKSVCKGVPSCAECRVRLVEGEHNVLPPGSEELSLIGTGHFIDRRRLSCQLKCFGDITVDMTEQIAKEQGLIVGRKKKLAIKDDRVEQAVVRRSEDAPPDLGEEAGEAQGPRAARDSREPRGDRGPRQDRPSRNDRGGQRQPNQQAKGGPQQGGPRPPHQQPQSQPSQQQAQGAPGEPREGGGKRRRRRRGKGGGGLNPQGPSAQQGSGTAPNQPKS